ncbi:hypothetical protein POVCU2_0012570 [Plasmodium ovale curtisi]|uniref:Uncharacterized protein n=1 Tax=Plasmodium ovale curtisi TaxID=864141 RepID=A0A1A8VMR7_PLAOA|nr:hypothetical protein POVCU2_0012570 [Plasmodium ovale curtisi]
MVDPRTRVGTHKRAGITNVLYNLWDKEPGKLRAGAMCKMGRRETEQEVMEQICINQEESSALICVLWPGVERSSGFKRKKCHRVRWSYINISVQRLFESNIVIRNYARKMERKKKKKKKKGSSFVLYLKML